MPMDAKGKYHMNPHHAKMADSMPEKKEQGKAPIKKPTEAEPGDRGPGRTSIDHAARSWRWDVSTPSLRMAICRSIRRSITR